MMKTKLPFVLGVIFSFVFTSLLSQITITESNYALTSFKTIQQSDCDTVGVQNPNGGANMSWDYSGLVVSGTTEFQIGTDMSQSPNSSNFPNANALIKYPSHESFLEVRSTGLVIHGLYNITATYLELYTNPLLLQKFPMTYMDSHTDSAKSSYFIQGQTRQKAVGLSSEVIGYGSLTVMGKTYMNVLLEKSTHVAHVTGGTDVTLTSVAYKFHSEGHGLPVLQIIRSSFMTSSTTQYSNQVTYMEHKTNVTSSVNDFSTHQLSVYPNPAEDIISVQTEKRGNYLILNALGAIVQSGMLNDINNEIEIKNLNSGVYFLQVNLDGAIQTERFFKQ